MYKFSGDGRIHQYQYTLQHTIQTDTVAVRNIFLHFSSAIFRLQKYVRYPSADTLLSTLHFIATMLVRYDINPYICSFVESESHFACIRALAPLGIFNSQAPTPAVWLRAINIHHHKNFISQVWFPIRFKLIFHAEVVTLSVAQQTTLCRPTQQ